MYKNYVFDLYGTLLDIRTNENKPHLWKKMSEIYSAFGATYTAAELKKRFRQLEKQLSQELPQYGEPDLRKVFESLFSEKDISADASTIKAIGITFRALSRNLLRVYDGVFETLQMLKSHGKGVYLLSNAQTDFTVPELDMMDLTGYFDGILISSEEGYKKPAENFYKALFERFDLKPQECLMVGNDETSDIAGALKVGMDSLYIHTKISPKDPPKGLATYCVMEEDWSKVRQIICDLENGSIANLGKM